MLLLACPSPHGTNQWHLLRVEMGLKELLGQGELPLGERPPPGLLVSRPLPWEDDGVGDSTWRALPPAWLGTFHSLLPHEAGRGAGGLHRKAATAIPASAARGTNQGAMEEAAPASCLCAHDFPQGHRRETGASVWRGWGAVFAGA